MNEHFEKIHYNLRKIIPKPLRNPYISLAIISGAIAVASGIEHLDTCAKTEYQEARTYYDKGARTIEPSPEDYNPVRKVIDKIVERIIR